MVLIVVQYLTLVEVKRFCPYTEWFTFCKIHSTGASEDLKDFIVSKSISVISSHIKLADYWRKRSRSTTFEPLEREARKVKNGWSSYSILIPCSTSIQPGLTSLRGKEQRHSIASKTSSLIELTPLALLAKEKAVPFPLQVLKWSQHKGDERNLSGPSGFAFRSCDSVCDFGRGRLHVTSSSTKRHENRH